MKWLIWDQSFLLLARPPLPNGFMWGTGFTFTGAGLDGVLFQGVRVLNYGEGGNPVLAQNVPVTLHILHRSTSRAHTFYAFCLFFFRSELQRGSLLLWRGINEF